MGQLQAVRIAWEVLLTSVVDQTLYSVSPISRFAFRPLAIRAERRGRSQSGTRRGVRPPTGTRSQIWGVACYLTYE
jgi:hypothetical protein